MSSNNNNKKPNDFNEQIWKRDVEAFNRWSKFHQACTSQAGKDRALKILMQLQAKHKHKLGDMP